MLRILGSRKTLCDGMTRRDFLHVGGLGAFGLGLGDLLRRQQAQATPLSLRGKGAGGAVRRQKGSGVISG